jgi:hypothetical protein
MKLHLFSLFFSSCLLISSEPFIAVCQAQSGAPRIRAQIVETSRFTLRGNTLPAERLGREVGVADPTARADRLLLVLLRSPDQEAALHLFLDSLQDPHSPNFRKFLTPEQFGTRFGIAESDLAKITGWLREHGFQVAGTNKGRTAVEFSGTVGQLQEAFQAPIRNYSLRGVQRWANSADPSIPSALSGVVAGVANLNDIKPRSMSIAGPRGVWRESAHRIVPNLTIPVGSQPYLFVTPADAGTIYDVPNSLNANLAGQTQYDGTGVTIGVIGNVFPDFTGVNNYRALFGLPSGHTTIVRDGDYGTFDQSADQTEALLDSEVSGGLAPGANVILYTAGDTLFQSGVMLAINRAIDDNNVGILSVSYGECESDLGAAGNLQILQAWEQAAAQGMAVTVAAGDNGSAGCDDFNTEQAAQFGLAVNGLASTPYNVAVGGTDFDVLKTGFGSYVSLGNSGNYTSALKYIPENPWNNSTGVNGMLASNAPLTNSKGQTNIVAGSGGASSLGAVEISGSSIPYPKPQWQQNYSASNQDSARDLPDVSLFSGNGLYGALWAVCEPSDCTGGSQWTIRGVGGTSASAPALAGILAIVNQKVGASTRLGQPNWILYRLAQSAPSVFHQVTTGNNSVYCQAGSPNCNANHFLSGYNAGPSYSFATGLGSIDASALVSNWNSIALTSTATTLNLDQTSFVHGTPVNITATVAPSDSTGNVAIVNDSGSQSFNISSDTGTTVVISGGTASGSFGEFPGGKYNVYARYGGDGSHGGSVSQPVAVSVSPENSTLRLLVSAINSTGATNASGHTWPLGTFISINAQPIGVSQASNTNPITNATGVVGIYDSPGSGPQFGNGQTVLDSTGNAEWNNQLFQAGTHAITAYYDGDWSYNPSTSSTVNFTIAPAPPSISISSDVSTIFSGSANLMAAISAPVSPWFNVQGTVSFTDATTNQVLGTAPPFSGCSGITTACGTAVLPVNVNQFAMGANQITATYSGDPNFTSAGPSTAITVTCTAGCSNGTGRTLQLSFFGSTPPGPLSAGASNTTFVDVSPGGGFTGAVNLTCAVTGKNGADIHIPTCSFSPTSVSISGTDAVQSTLTLKSTAGTSSSVVHTSSSWKPAATVLAVLVLFALPKRRQKIGPWVGMLLLIVMAGWISACGGGGSPSSSTPPPTGGGTPGTTPDTYTVTFRAADATGTVTAQNYFNFNVQ